MKTIPTWGAIILGLVLSPNTWGESVTVDQLTPAEVKFTWEKLNDLIQKSGGIEPLELERARLQGVLQRMGKNARLIIPKSNDENENYPIARTEIFPRSIIYVRPGKLTSPHLSQIRDAIQKNRALKEVNAVILDLRSTPGEENYDVAASLCGLFAGGGKTLFSITHGGSPEKNYSAQGDAVFTGIVLILTNADCGGAAETIAAVLRQQVRALIIGQATTGHALEFTTLPIRENLNLQVATGRVVLPGAAANMLEKGATPDLLVASNIDEEREILKRSDAEDMAQFVFEIESPRLNEASLIAGKNPEIDAYQSRKNTKKQPEETPLLDRALQRALDAATSLLVLKGYGSKPGN